MCLRSHNESRLAWTLTSLAVRIGHALDLHRDGAGSSFSPFEAEMRRRLWWQINVLDLRASEDRGFPPIILEHSFNTKMPSNINDEDLDLTSGEKIVERPGCTEMTFCLISHEVLNVVRRLNSVLPDIGDDHQGKHVAGWQVMEDLIKGCSQLLESKYLIHCDTTVPIFWVSLMVARLIILKMWLFLQYPLYTRRSASGSDASKENILKSAIAILELTNALETNEFAANWTWFLNTYVQWHPLAVTLAVLCSQTRGPVVEKAWAIVETVFEKWSDRVADTKRGTLWRPIRKLLAKAQAAKLQECRVEDQTIASSAMQDWVITDMEHGQAALRDFQSDEWYNASLAVIEEEALGGPKGLPLQFQSSQLNGCIPTDVSPGDQVDPANWVVWDEFIESTRDTGNSAQENSSVQWTAQLGV